MARESRGLARLMRYDPWAGHVFQFRGAFLPDAGLPACRNDYPGINIRLYRNNTPRMAWRAFLPSHCRGFVPCYPRLRRDADLSGICTSATSATVLSLSQTVPQCSLLPYSDRPSFRFVSLPECRQYSWRRSTSGASARRIPAPSPDAVPASHKPACHLS